MILTIDAGNTNITFALYSNEGQNLHEFRIITKKKQTSDELGLVLRSFVDHNNLSSKDITGVIVGSVVPAANDIIKCACKKYESVKWKWDTLSPCAVHTILVLILQSLIGVNFGVWS